MAPAPQERFNDTCPSCGKKFRIEMRFEGKQIRCKACGQVWRAQAKRESANGDMQNNDTAGSSQLSVVTAMGLSGTSSQGGSGSQISPEDDSTWIGQALGRFQITDLLGKGAMGVVFCAHDPDLKRDVALKILTKQFIRKQKRTYRLEQFVREAQSAARLAHPNSVTVYEIGQDKGWYFIAMELVEGGTLLDLIRKHRKRAPIEAACELVAQAADALSAAHKLGIIHRDIKPSNLMLTRDNRIKVTDFGLVQMADETGGEFDLPSKAVGTPYWMSPEQCKGETAVPQSDIYSLAALLFFVLTGEVPYKGKTKREILLQHVNASPPDPRTFRKDVPETLVRILQRAMAKNPHERYQDAAEMAIGLRQVASNLAQARMAERWWSRLAGTGTTTTTAPAHSKSRAALKIGVIGILLAAIIAGLVLWKVLAGKKPARRPVLTPPVQVEPTIPVIVVPGTVYHVEPRKDPKDPSKGFECPKLKPISPEVWETLDSEAEAKKRGLTACTYCAPEITKRLEDARKKSGPGK